MSEQNKEVNEERRNLKARATRFANSHLVSKLTRGALQHPFWGGVSVQLPVPKAPLFENAGANHRFALSTLFAILQPKLLQPPLHLRKG